MNNVPPSVQNNYIKNENEDQEENYWDNRFDSKESMKKLLEQLTHSFSLEDKEELAQNVYNEGSFAPHTSVRSNAISSLMDIDKVR